MLIRRAALLALPLTCALVTGCAGASRASRTARALTTAAAPSAGAASAGSPRRHRVHVAPGHEQRTYRGTGGFKTVTVKSGGHLRTYLLYVPPGDSREHPLALVLIFHGAGETARQTVAETDLPNIAKQDHNMILVFPQGYDDTWNEGTGNTPAAQARINDVAFAATILRRVEDNYAVDRHRVVATGFSNGALLTEYLGCTLSRQLTMIAPVEGQLPEVISQKCHPPAPLTVFEVHGTADSAIPYAGGAFTGIDGRPGPPVLSAPDSAQRWATLDHCTGKLQSKTSGAVTFGTYGSCQDDVTVTLATVNGGQHVWPSGYGPTLANAIAALPATRTAIR